MSSTLVKYPVMVEFTELGEGYNGDYNPHDPTDVELLRFYVSADFGDGYEDLEDASYCTEFPASATQAQQDAAVRLVMDKVYLPIMEHYPDKDAINIRKLCERLSWINLDWVIHPESAEQDWEKLNKV